MNIKFEGFIESIDEEVAVCRFVNDDKEEFYMEIPLKDFNEEDAKELKLGSILTYECTYTLTLNKDKWTEEEIEAAKKKGKEMSDYLQGK